MKKMKYIIDIKFNTIFITVRMSVNFVSKGLRRLKLGTSVLPHLEGQQLNCEKLLLICRGKPSTSSTLSSVRFPETQKLVFKDCDSKTIASWTTKHRFPNLKELYMYQPPGNGYALPFLNRFQQIDEEHILHKVFNVPTQDGVTINTVNMPHTLKPIGDINTISEKEFNEVVNSFSSGDVISKEDNDKIIGIIDSQVIQFNEYKNKPDDINPSYNWTEFTVNTMTSNDINKTD